MTIPYIFRAGPSSSFFSLTSFMPSFTQGEISSGSSELYLKYRIAASFKGIFDEFERLGNFIVITDFSLFCFWYKILVLSGIICLV